MDKIEENKLIAPCGMNCALCQAFQGKGLKCMGCGNETLRKSCQNCTILKCGNKKRFCFECVDYPCDRLKRLDKRYRTNYHMSMLENLDYIQIHGIDEFIKQQRKKYTCEACGELKSVHQNYCLHCKRNI